MNQLNILMVCLGNICRSPLAQGILESKVDPKKVRVDSAGTAAYHTGNPPDPRSILIAKNQGINIKNQRARPFCKEDFNIFSKIFVMDQSNYDHVVALADTQQNKDKVQLILGSGQEVPDPYYGGEDGFQHCFELLDEACNRIKTSIENGDYT
jgi:protein-tyrosine phosphatase